MSELGEPVRRNGGAGSELSRSAAADDPILVFDAAPPETKAKRVKGIMSDLNETQNPTFYRVRIKDGHDAIGLLVRAAGKRCIPSTQFWLTVHACAD